MNETLFKDGSKTQVLVYPECMLCGEPTDNIVQHTERKSHSHGQWNKKTITTISTTRPFAAHESCIRKLYRTQNAAILVPLTILLGAILYSWVSKVDFCNSLGWMLFLLSCLLAMYAYNWAKDSITEAAKKARLTSQYLEPVGGYMYMLPNNYKEDLLSQIAEKYGEDYAERLSGSRIRHMQE